MRLHVENDPNASPDLYVTPTSLAAALSRFPAVLGSIVASFNERPAAFPACMGDAEAVVSVRTLDLRAAKAANPRLRLVQITHAGVERYRGAVPDGLSLCNASGVHAGKGAEFILAACLMLNFRIPHFMAARAREAWLPSYGGTLAGRRVTMLGVGAIGAAAIDMLRPFGVRLTGVTRTGRASVALDRCVAPDALDAVLPETDILVSTLPLTPETAGLVDARRVDLLPRGAGVVVVGRAKVLDYPAILRRLADETLEGAVLDVFPEEPIPPGDPLWRVPRLVATPHCSLDDHSIYRDACLAILADNLERLRTGQPLRNVVDPERGY